MENQDTNNREESKIRVEAQNQEEISASQVSKKRIFGRGVYGSKDVPIKILDVLIIAIVIIIIGLAALFASNGGYQIQFDTYGGSEVATQKIEYGAYVQEPETPMKAGYEFVQWVNSEDESLQKIWNFTEDKVEGDMTLYAVWVPAEIVVRLDMDGGAFTDREVEEQLKVTFGETYGELPIPEKEGFVFDGWEYSGMIITEDTQVTTSGEHILKALWK